MSPSTKANVMTIGVLSRRSGVPVKTLREYEDMGLIYTVGRTAGNYRLFDDDALWCIGVINTMRSLGLTLAEIRELAGAYLQRGGDPIGPRLASVLKEVRARVESRIAEQKAVLKRIDKFESARRAELTGNSEFRTDDPRSRSS